MQLSKYTLNDLGKVDNKDFVKEAFRAVITNGGPAINKSTGSCMYRAFDGTACAVGVCLDDAMVKSIEVNSGCLITDIVADASILVDFMPSLKDVTASSMHVNLLTQMQLVHDDAAESCFEAGAPMSIEALIYAAERVGPSLTTELILKALDELEDELEDELQA